MVAMSVFEFLQSEKVRKKQDFKIFFSVAVFYHKFLFLFNFEGNRSQYCFDSNNDDLINLNEKREYLRVSNSLSRNDGISLETKI